MQTPTQTQVTLPRMALETLAIALVYVGLGKLGQILALPPGNVTILWPPSGLALALAILFGARSLPGIFLGALLANLVPSSPDDLHFDLMSLAGATGIAIGSCIQPWVGREIWRRVRTERGFFVNIRNASIFLVLAPSMCLISSTIGTASLRAAGLITPDAVTTVWSTWWFGDTVGVLVFGPLVGAAIRMARLRALILISVVLSGFALAYQGNTYMRQQAETVWLEKASLATSRLSETYLLWLDLSYAALHSVSTLFHGSDFVNEDEFLDAVDGLEDSGVGHLPVSIAFVSDSAETDDWKITFSTDDVGPMAKGTSVAASSVLGKAMLASREGSTRIRLLGAMDNADGEKLVVAMIRIGDTRQEGAILAFVNLSALADGLKSQPGSSGLQLRLAIDAQASDGVLQRDFLIGSSLPSAETRETFEVRSQSAGTQFSFLWDVLPSFDGGPQVQSADLVLISGVVLASLVGIFLTFLLTQNEVISRRVRDRTGELVEKTKLMEAIMASMSQGITAFDADLKLIAANEKFREIRGYPAEMVFEGQDFENLIRYDVEHNEFGDGDPEKVLGSKVQIAKRFEPHMFERQRPNGTHIEVQGGPLPGGGFVSTYTDISERKETETRIAEQVRELEDARRATLNMMADAETARKRAEEAREEADAARRQLQLAMDNMTDGIYMLDADMCFTLFNERYRELVELTEAEVDIGKSVREAVRAHAERGDYGDGDLEDAIEQRMQILADGEMTELQMVLEGGQKFLDLRKAPIEDGGAVVVVTDATNRMIAQRELSDALTVISESIEYASNIQRSILPSEELFESILSGHFVLWEPRDIVGGDMYWCDVWGDGLLIVLGDCTGHGVPGAFMTLIADGALQRAKSEIVQGDIAALVQRMHQMIQISLGQHRQEGSSDDGIDLGICYINDDLTALKFAGAHFSLFVLEDGAIEEIKGTRRGLGYRGIPLTQTYDVKTIPLESGMTMVMTSDGLIDQIGGPRRRGFGKRRFKDMMADVQDRPLEEWRDIILKTLTDYQGDESRRDDVSLVGFKI